MQNAKCNPNDTYFLVLFFIFSLCIIINNFVRAVCRGDTNVCQCGLSFICNIDTLTYEYIGPYSAFRGCRTAVSQTVVGNSG